MAKFITFEGGEGCGKSTQSKMLVDALKNKGLDVLHTREIGGTPLAEKIRDLIMQEDFLSKSELFLIMAARCEHLNNVIIPALKKGIWVICDRFIDSTAAYQTINSDLTKGDIYNLHQIMAPSSTQILPDLTFFLDISPKEGMKRALSRGVVNKFEEKTTEYHLQVYNNFKEIAQIYKNRVCAIDCTDKTIHYVHEEILKRLRIIDNDKNN